MALRYSAKGSASGDYKSCPAGTFLAVCNAVVDLGLQPGSGMYPEPKHQVWVRWEIPSLRVKWEKDGKKLEGPQVINKTYTASMGEKAKLRKDLQSWRGKAFSDDEASQFDVSSILGTSCMLGVVEKVSGEKTYSNVGSILALPAGVPKMTAENPLLYYDSENKEQFSALPEWIRNKISNPAKIQASHATGTYAQDDQYEVADRLKPQDGQYFASSKPVDDTYITDEDIPF